MTAAEAVAEAKRRGEPLELEEFDYELEVGLGDLAESWCPEDETETRTRYAGAGWVVVLVGNGDPQ